MPTVLLLLLCATPAPLPASAPSVPAGPWETLAPGVEWAEFDASMKSLQRQQSLERPAAPVEHRAASKP